MTQIPKPGADIDQDPAIDTPDGGAAPGAKAPLQHDKLGQPTASLSLDPEGSVGTGMTPP
ncbi:MAG: hypothetical protein ACJ8GW_08665 [Massilia sp.]